MYEDVEADFWKQILVTLQQKNMTRVGAQSLYFDGVEKAFNEFSKNKPDVKSSLEMASSYATIEMEVSSTIKFRLFIQSQIKGTLLQKNGNDFIKIADAKFPNDPFPEIVYFFDHLSENLEQLSKITNDSIHNNKKQQIAGEFLKAHLDKKYKNQAWTLDTVADGFILTVENQQKHISLENLFENNYDF